MEKRKRNNTDRTAVARAIDPVQPTDGADLEAARSEGARLLAAAGQVIDQFLSGDSEAFITQARQQGGQ